MATNAARAPARKPNASRAPKRTSDRWQRRRHRTRTALIEAALDRFRDQGYDATTIEEITDAADISPRTFFHYFDSKEELLISGHQERRDALIATLNSELEDRDVWPAIQRACLTIVDALEADPHFFLERAKLCAGEPTLRSAVLRLNDRLVDDMTVVLARHLDENDDSALAPRLIATLANGSMRAAIDTWVAADGAVDLRGLAVEAMEVVRPAIAEALERTAG